MDTGDYRNGLTLDSTEKTYIISYTLPTTQYTQFPSAATNYRNFDVRKTTKLYEDWNQHYIN